MDLKDASVEPGFEIISEVRHQSFTTEKATAFISWAFA
jgi:hypothetical protein